MTAFSKNLKALRQAKNIGQVELAREVGVSNGTISLWENGLREPKLSNLFALARYFEVSVDYLIGLQPY
jgi:transcriptional regulator with XRE-family HTH domain